MKNDEGGNVMDIIVALPEDSTLTSTQRRSGVNHRSPTFIGDGAQYLSNPFCSTMTAQHAGSSRASSQSLQKLKKLLSNGPLPSLFVFDLDYTLWSAYIDCTGGPPYQLLPPSTASDTVLDRHGHPISLYSNARSILKTLHAHKCKIGVASRSETPGWARQVLRLMFDKELIAEDTVEIYPTSKVKHFKAFRKNTGVDYSEMLFFDDENRNVVQVEKLGVKSRYVERGITIDEISEGIQDWREQRGTV